MFKNKQTLQSIIVVILFGFVLFFIGTNGFQAFTAEVARTNRLLTDKPQFPNVTLEDSKGRTYSFDEFAGKYVLLTFIYTACTDVCPKMEVNMAEVYKGIPKQYLGKDIVFLSISFDTERDDPATLEKYRAYFNSDGETWRMARIPNEEELQALLKEFGIVVIPDGNGNFTHNTSFYVVDPTGTLINVLDFQKIDAASDVVQSLLQQKGEE
ncbi:SCO family protein [Virgibacillus soli]|uniref:SCO family protein n=1 Tax=Paracerasibacillus soli TaxID=480284 RepID=A0ABU5CND7_9BACI|nr:SCO family protein [Virgibacillus soli]MDY0407851.1 SCO family protein [Virgibacillus soli]